MKKLFRSMTIFTGMFFLNSTVSTAQTYGIGVNALNLGVGFGYSIHYIANTSATPVMSASFEHGMSVIGPGTLGVGAILSYQGASWDYTDVYGDKYHEDWKTTLFGLRGTYHPDMLVSDKYDVYGGLQLVYYHYGYTYTESGPYVSNTHYTNPFNSHVGIGAFVGGRYYFTSAIGAFAEVGYDVSYLKAGLCFKFGTATAAPATTTNNK